MGKLESITTLATIAAGGLIFLKVYPLIEGFLKPAGAIGGAADFIGGGLAAGGGFLESLIPVPVGSIPLRTYEPVPDVRYSLTEDTAVIPDTTYPVSPQRLAYQESIGVPFVFPEQLQQPAPQVQQPTGILAWATQMLPTIPSFQTPQTGGQFWINPLTQDVIAPYVSGQTPQGVLDLRMQDILPAIRSF